MSSQLSEIAEPCIATTPFYYSYWEFLVNDQPAAKGIDNTILAAGDAVKFSFEPYIPDEHKDRCSRRSGNFRQELLLRNGSS